MSEKKKEMTTTEKWAAKNKKKTTAKDIPGKGAAKKTGYTIEMRNKKIMEI